MDSPRQRSLNRLTALRSERTTWVDHWRDLSDYIQPRGSRFDGQLQNKGTKRNSKIINSTATRALRVLQAGMMAGLTPRSRPWFRLTTPDPELGESGNVRAWLHVVEERLRLAFAKSNLYNALHGLYGSLALFGTAAMHVEEDAQDMLRAYLLPTGSFCLATGPDQRVDSVFRELAMTTAQLVERFGIDKVSRNVAERYKNGNGLDVWVDVVHVIEPRREYDTGKADAKNMPWRSCWMEKTKGAGDDYLLESGFAEWPTMAPRWDIVDGDVYGFSPGMEALGDVKGLQFLEAQKAGLVEKIVDPPMKGPTALINQRVSLLPGDVTYVDTNSGGQSFEPAMVVNPSAIGVVEESIQNHERRSNAMLYADLWLMVQSVQNGPQKTATEIAALQQEQMLQLGPVLERLEDELLDPVIDRAFGILLRAGALPPPPPELHGIQLRVEYTSVLAQAQKLVGISGLERLTSFVGNLAQAGGRPEVLDKIDGDKLVDEYASSLGVKPDLVRTNDQVAAIRQDRANQQAQAQAQQNAMAAVQAAKTIGDTNPANLQAILGAGGAGGGAV